MDWDLVIIMPSVIVMLLILGVSANGIVSKILEHKRWEKEGNFGLDGGGKNQRADKIEDRLQVLERLATDRGQLLSDQIEKLRDKREEEGKV